MLQRLRNFFGINRKRTITLEQFKVLKQEYLELFQIANANVRYLRGSLNVANSMINACGIRYARKKKPFVDMLKIKLEEEEYYVEKYERIYDILENERRIPLEISSQVVLNLSRSETYYSK